MFLPILLFGTLAICIMMIIAPDFAKGVARTIKNTIITFWFKNRK